MVMGVKRNSYRTSDKDLKEFFLEYHEAGARLQILDLEKRQKGKLSDIQKQEYENLLYFRMVIDSVLESLPSVISEICTRCYINREQMWDISADMGYAYEQVSAFKVQGGNMLRKIFGGEEVLQSTLSLNTIKHIYKTIQQLTNEDDM